MSTDGIFPGDGVMLALLAHAAGDGFTVCENELRLTVQSADSTIPAPDEALDELERRGWVEVKPDGATAITERGGYWITRWLVKRFGAKGRLVKRLGRVPVAEPVRVDANGNVIQ